MHYVILNYMKRFGGNKMDLDDLLTRDIEVNKNIENIDNLFKR